MWSRKRWQWKCTPYFLKLLDWKIIIKLFNVIYRTLIGGGSYPSAEKQLVYSTATRAYSAWVELRCLQYRLFFISHSWKNFAGFVMCFLWITLLFSRLFLPIISSSLFLFCIIHCFLFLYRRLHIVTKKATNVHFIYLLTNIRQLQCYLCLTDLRIDYGISADLQGKIDT